MLNTISLVPDILAGLDGVNRLLVGEGYWLKLGGHHVK